MAPARRRQRISSSPPGMWDFDDGHRRDSGPWSPTLSTSRGPTTVQLYLVGQQRLSQWKPGGPPDFGVHADEFRRHDPEACRFVQARSTRWRVSQKASRTTASPTSTWGRPVHSGRPDAVLQFLHRVDGVQLGTSDQSADDFENFFINFEHSFMGDLTVSLHLPRRQFDRGSPARGRRNFPGRACRQRCRGQ